MKFLSAILICIVLLFSPGLSAKVKADQYFDSYGKIPWNEEQLRLDNFAVFLEEKTEVIGYIGLYVGKRDTQQSLMKRVVRAKKYLVHRRKIDKSRIVIVCAGKREDTKIVLQPVLKNLPPPF